jgi:tRNA threonylcarbamoyladenosine biosynthesis protein TsaE
MTNEFICNGLENLPEIAAELLKKFRDKRIFAFYGGMGAGKTTLIKEICKQMGIKDNVTSPSFGIINCYKGNSEEVFHFDFYRIKDIKEVYDIGYEEYFYGIGHCFIEWPELIEQLLPEDTVRVIIENSTQDNIRKVIF